MPEHSVIMTMLDPKQIKVDADTYQFRAKGDAKGVTDAGRHQETEWDPIIHGNPILVHQRLDGSFFVADGHHRVDLAKRLQTEGKGPSTIAAMVLREADGYTPEDVKIIAALKNINDGHSSVVEAARVIQETQRGIAGGKIHEHLLPKLDDNKTLLKQSTALSHLSQQGLARVEMGDVSLNAAMIVALNVQDQKQQDDMLREITYITHQPYNGQAPIHVPASEMSLGSVTLNQQPSFAQKIMAQRFGQAAAPARTV
ncbi:MAG: hypothetical protein SFT92_02335 [Rickettsiales bacterium]|nr:hypothetical protein [Rickettsiales bacterium]